MAQPSSIPQREQSFGMPVEAGFSLKKTLIAPQLPGCPGLVIALLVGIFPLAPFPTASFQPGSYHCDLAAAATPTVRARHVLHPLGIDTPEQPFGGVRAGQKPPSSSSPSSH